MHFVTRKDTARTHIITNAMFVVVVGVGGDFTNVPVQAEGFSPSVKRQRLGQYLPPSCRSLSLPIPGLFLGCGHQKIDHAVVFGKGHLG